MYERRSRDTPIEETTMRIVTYVAPVRRKETDFAAHVYVAISRRTERSRTRRSRSRTCVRVFAPRRREVVLRFRYDERDALATYESNIYVALRCKLADRQITYGYGATGRIRSSNVDCTETEREQKRLRGLLATTRERVTEGLRRLPEKERNDLTAIRRLATARGNTYRAQVQAAESTKAHTRAKARTKTL